MGGIRSFSVNDTVVCQVLTELTKSTIRIFRTSAGRIRETKCENVPLAKRGKDYHPYSRDLYAYLFEHRQQ